ncbi:UNVERIFIED_CONTAM: hypothetical protein FKN15_044812 [Acipenser sinensis]
MPFKGFTLSLSKRINICRPLCPYGIFPAAVPEHDDNTVVGLPIRAASFRRIGPWPSNLLLDRNSTDITAFRSMGDWLESVRTVPCKEHYTGVSYSSCNTLAKTSVDYGSPVGIRHPTIVY